MSKQYLKIRSFRDLELQKTKVKYELRYKEDLMNNGIVVFRETFRRSVLLSLRSFAQDTLSSMIVKLIRSKRRKKKSDQ